MIEVQLLKKFPAVDKGKIFIKKFISIKLFKFNLFNPFKKYILAVSNESELCILRY